MSTLNKILVPVDGSEPGFRALAHAVSMAKATGASLDVVTVIDLRQVDVYEGFYLTDAQLEILEKNAHEKILDHAKEMAEGVPTTARLLHGPALKTLLSESESDEVSMVVMGRTGKNAFERIFEGSVSRGLSAHCTKPVTVVP